MKKLSHINNKGEANMVDIQDKKSSKRVAIAEGSITLSKKALNQINDDKVSYDWQKRNLKGALDKEPIDPTMYKDDTELDKAAQ